MRPTRALVIGLLFGVALGPGPSPGAASPQATPRVKTLMQKSLADEFTPGREVLVDLVEIPPATALERHWHPGEEFHYYLEGEAEIQVEGEPPILGRPGSVGHVPFKKPHRAVAGKTGAKVLVFRVHTEGEPWRYAAP